MVSTGDEPILLALVQARLAAEAVRQLNHATLRSDGYEWPSDIDAVIAELHLVAARMDQALRQATRWLQRAHAAGLVGHDQSIDPSEAIARAADLIDIAATRASQLGTDLAHVRSVSACLTGLAPLPDAEPPPRPSPTYRLTQWEET